ncbi:MAG: hypothetical protein PVF74_07315 [Anaerolineales bacterium]|jgi:hypothetical protein
MVGYFISLPERTLRALAIFLGGLVHETAEVLLPGWLRRSSYYQATIGGLLRIAIELLDGLSGILPSDDIEAGDPYRAPDKKEKSFGGEVALWPGGETE